MSRRRRFELPWVDYSGAGHFIQGKYRVYGEGSVRHNGHACEHGPFGEDHPLIFRHDYPSQWAHRRQMIANWWMGRAMQRNGRRLMAGGPWHESRMDRLMWRIFGPPFGRVPRVEAGMPNESSIYDRTRASGGVPVDLEPSEPDQVTVK